MSGAAGQEAPEEGGMPRRTDERAVSRSGQVRAKWRTETGCAYFELGGALEVKI
jgi:hypothetical protein